MHSTILEIFRRVHYCLFQIEYSKKKRDKKTKRETTKEIARKISNFKWFLFLWLIDGHMNINQTLCTFQQMWNVFSRSVYVIFFENTQRKKKNKLLLSFVSAICVYILLYLLLLLSFSVARWTWWLCYVLWTHYLGGKKNTQNKTKKNISELK